MIESVIQRIRTILKQKRISINALSGMIDMTQVTLNRQISGESSMTLETFILIMNKFPDVSLDWVFSGYGEMIKGKSPANSSEKEFVVYVDENGFLKLKK